MEERDIVEAFDTSKAVYDFDFQLKDEQVTVLTALLNKRNVFGFLPTGYGKSMCYVLPPLLLDEVQWDSKHVAIVISPLKALMADQVRNLSNQGVKAFAVEPGITQEETTSIKNGQYSVVFISPESATSKYWRHVFLSDELKDRICLLACDEAHCISEWGEDFRPVYKDVLSLRSVIDSPVLAVTATCDEKVRSDIFNSLALDANDTLTVARTPDRPNIYIDVRSSKQDYEKDLTWIIDYLVDKTTSAKKIIVYCRSVNTTSALYNHFKHELILKGVDENLVDMFHRSIDQDSMERILESFKETDSPIRCLFSTVAFGMGVQILDISIIIHWGAPKSVLSYWQEIGRGGRDGRQAFAVCYAYGRSLVKKKTDEVMINVVKNVVQEMKCARGEYLRALSIEGMANICIDRQRCTNCGEQSCECQMCRCCSVCFGKCTCPKKHKSLLEKLGI